MLLEASRKPGLAGCLSLADACRIPLADGAADLTLCSFALGYIPSPHQAIGEMARVSRKGGRVVVTDLHPCAQAAGWTRSFRSNGQVYEIDHYEHPVAAWEAAAESAGLALDWRVEACFGEPEREIFRQAGKASSVPGIEPHSRAARHVLDEAVRLTGARVAFGATSAERIDLEILRGRIQPFGSCTGRGPELNLDGHLILPGLINCHDHLEFNLFPAARPGSVSKCDSLGRRHLPSRIVRR